MRADNARLRIALLTPFFRPVVGGSESNAERLARYLQEHGFAVRVITKRIGRELPAVETCDGLRVERIGPYGERSAAGKWRIIPAALAWLVRQRATYDVVCCVDYRGIGVAAIAARPVTGRPVVLQAQTAGVLQGGSLASRVGKAVPRAFYRRADAFACISRDIERETLSCGISRGRVHHLPNAIDMRHFAPSAADERRAVRRQHGLADDAVVCLFVGRLSREKGVMELLEAWRSVSGAVLIVAGPDMEHHPWDVGPAARAYARAHGLEPSVRFPGPIADVAPLIGAADIVVQPSHFEALGLSAIEALACGVPVVATATGGLLDFVVEGHNGLLCPPHDPAALARAIRRLVDDPSLRRRLAERARASVREDYDEQAVFSRFAALLGAAAGRRQ
ncbi:MAG: glycosyltransferase family 4 protein [Acidobacteria bacterium]|nr:glycosyltransferase family 4 protein [Acidobacteriota bacterium]